jgi:uncharacterized membrane protein YdbT with pleckstrin-like domain
MIEVDVDEKIERIVRKHWFVLLGNIIVLVLAIMVPVILFGALLFTNIPGLSVENSVGVDAIGVFLLFSWLLIVWMAGWKIWTDYYLDVLIITDRRIFDIEQIGFFKRDSSSFRLDRIQNISVTVNGLIATYFNFGTVRIETAGEKEQFLAPYIASPYDVKKFINDKHDMALEKAQVVHIAEGELPTNTKAITDRSGIS